MAEKLNYSDLSSSFGKNMTKRGENWRERETLILIATWKDFKHDLMRMKRNQYIYASMSQVMKLYGIDRTWDEIRRKVKNLAVLYRREKLQVKRTGRPSKWVYFSRIRDVLGDLKVKRPFRHDISPKKPIKYENQYHETQSEDDTYLNDDNGETPYPFTQTYEGESSAEGEATTSQSRLNVDPDAVDDEYVSIRNKYLNMDEKRIENVLEDALEEFRAMRQESREMDREFLEVFKKQNELLEKVLSKV